MTTCRALVPMDTQVITAIKQIDKGKSTHQRAMASIKATTRLISIEGALCILDAYGYSDSTFHFDGQKWAVRDIGDETHFPFIQGRMAHETMVFWFWGGPPTKLKWYKGTLQTFLDDRVLYEIGRRGAVEVAKLIGTDLEGLANVPTSAVY